MKNFFLFSNVSTGSHRRCSAFDINQKGKNCPKISPVPPLINPFLSVLHQNKALHNFRKREHRLIVEHNVGLEYAQEHFRETAFVRIILQSLRDFLPG